MKVRYLTRKLNDYNQLPSYHDGQLELYEVFYTKTFPQRYIKTDCVKVYYAEKAIFNKTKLAFKQVNLEITYMLKTPLFVYDKNKTYVAKIDGSFHEVQNITVVTNSNGFKEIEITCIRLVQKILNVNELTQEQLNG